jgi:DNA-binding MarR family transcriptional regulator
MSVMDPTDSTGKLLHKALRLTEAFRELDPNLGAQTIATLITVALTPGLSPNDLVERLGYTGASASRNWTHLSTRRNGLGLIHDTPDVRDYRRRVLHLTPRGIQFLLKIIAILADDEPS